MKVSGAQITAARGLLRITQVELATAAGLSYATVLTFEAGTSEPQAATMQKLVAELERRGIEFTNGDGAGVRINFAKAAEFARSAGQTRSEPDR